jgi:hypothetical protein
MVEITAASGVNKDNVLKFPAFIRWRDSLLESLALQNKDATHKFHSDPYELKAIEFKGAMLWKNNTAGFVFLNATCKNKAGDSLDGGVFLRGDSVVIMVSITISASLKADLTQDSRSWWNQRIPQARISTSS